MIDQDLALKVQSTLSAALNLIQGQNTKIAALEARVAALENGHTDKPTEMTMQERFALSSMRNRRIRASAEAIAFAAHLFFIRQVPCVRIYEHNLLTQSKAQALTQWEPQHLQDFVDVQGVRDVYENGLPDDKAQELMEDYEGFREYLSSKKD